MDEKFAIRTLREALHYLVEMREIKCLHQHEPHEDEWRTCAKCKADRALMLTTVTQRRTHESRWKDGR